MSYSPSVLERSILEFARGVFQRQTIFHSDDLVRRFIRTNDTHTRTEIEDAIQILTSQKYFDKEVKTTKVPGFKSRYVGVSTPSTTFKTEYLRISGKALLYLDNRESSTTQSEILGSGSSYNVRRKFEETFSSAKTRIEIVDNYIGRVTLDYLLSGNAPIKIITSSKSEKNFDNALKSFREQYENTIDIKIVDNIFHGRFMIVDERYYLIDHSIKDFGSKPSTFIEIKEDAVKKTYEALFTKYWG